MSPQTAVAFGLWGLFLLGWYLAAFWVSRGKASARTAETWAYFIGWGVGFGLLFSPFMRLVFGAAARSPLRASLWATPPAIAVALILVQLAAFAFAWWARIQMGRLWSGHIVVREDHRVVDTGPFRLVRHPIYTGYIVASWALALIGGLPQALAGAAVLTTLMVLKSRREERFLRQELGPEAYDAYAARTPQLIPFVGWR